MAYFVQMRVSEAFGVDIHPAARVGKGIMIDHAHSIVIGETAVVGDNVSMLHSVTLGGTGKEDGDRHPKIDDGVLIGAGAKVLGNIRVGHCSRIAAGSVVLEDVPLQHHGRRGARAGRRQGRLRPAGTDHGSDPQAGMTCTGMKAAFRSAAAVPLGKAIILFARFVTAPRALWLGIEPMPRQRVYFANHTSNGDFVLIWTVLPAALRNRTRPGRRTGLLADLAACAPLSGAMCSMPS